MTYVNFFRACVKAGIEIWSPNRLRHSAGSKVREKYGLEYAQAVLGHANAKTAEIYAEVSFEKAASHSPTNTCNEIQEVSAHTDNTNMAGTGLEPATLRL
ncbi:MAG: tyrosine-type recombinase/integrase [Planctomycetaceae bacterium]|nr:tyrosine-type recombinase/integrase [Planctomycetaceae bacterium]